MSDLWRHRLVCSGCCLCRGADEITEAARSQQAIGQPEEEEGRQAVPEGANR